MSRSAVGEIHDKTTIRCHDKSTRMAKINITSYIKCYQECEATRTFMYQYAIANYFQHCERLFFSIS